MPTTQTQLNDVLLTASIKVDKKQPKVSILAYTGGLMNVGGWGNVVIDLEGLELPAKVPLLADHDSSLSGVIGHGTCKVSNNQLFIEGKLVTSTDAAKTIVQVSSEGVDFQA